MLRVALTAPTTTCSAQWTVLNLQVADSYVQGNGIYAWIEIPDGIDRLNRPVPATFVSGTNGAYRLSAPFTVPGTTTTIPTGAIVVPLGALKAGTTTRITVTVAAPSGTLDQTKFFPRAYAVASNATLVSGQTAQPITVTAKTSPFIYKSAPGTYLIDQVDHVRAGQTLNYQLHLGNWWNAPGTCGQTLPDTVVYDNVSNLLTGLGGSPVFTGNISIGGNGLFTATAIPVTTPSGAVFQVPANSVYWIVGELGVGQHVYLDYSVQLKPQGTATTGLPDGHEILNTATIASPDPAAREGAHPVDNHRVIVGAIDNPKGFFATGVSLQGPTGISVNDDLPNYYATYGGVVSWILYAQNSGASEIDDVVTTAQIPDGVTFVGASVPAGSGGQLWYHDASGGGDALHPPEVDIASGQFTAGHHWTQNPAALGSVKYVFARYPRLASVYFPTNGVPQSVSTQIDVTVDLPTSACPDITVKLPGLFQVYSYTPVGAQYPGATVPAGTPTQWVLSDQVNQGEPVQVRAIVPSLGQSDAGVSASVLQNTGNVTFYVNLRNVLPGAAATDTALNVRARVTLPKMQLAGTPTPLPLVSVNSAGGTLDMAGYPDYVDVTWPSVAPYALRQLAFTFFVGPGYVSGDTPILRATLSADDDVCGAVPSVQVAAQTRLEANPFLVVRKRSDLSVASPGSDISYTLSYVNLGPAAALDAYIVDKLPEGFTVKSVTPAPGVTYYFAPSWANLPADIDDPEFTWTEDVFLSAQSEFEEGLPGPGGTIVVPFEDAQWVAIRVGTPPASPSGSYILGVGAPAELTLTAHIDDDLDANGQTVTNRALIFADALLPAVSPAAGITLSYAPSIALAQSCPGVVAAGEELAIDIDYYNDTSSTIRRVAIESALPAGLELVAATHTWNGDTPSDIAAIDVAVSFDPGAGVAGTISLEPTLDLVDEALPSLAGGRVHLVLRVGAGTTTGTMLAVDSLATALDAELSLPAAIASGCTVQVANPDLYLRKLVDQSAPVSGQMINYTLIIANKGANVARGVTLTDELPAGLEYVGPAIVLTPGWTVPQPNVAGQTLSWSGFKKGAGTVGLFPGNSEDVLVSFAARVGGGTQPNRTYTNEATVATTSVEDQVYTNDASVDVVTPPPDVWVTKSGAAIARPGSTVRYTLRYGNDSGWPAGPTAIVDKLSDTNGDGRVDVRYAGHIAPNGEQVFFNGASVAGAAPAFDPQNPGATGWVTSVGALPVGDAAQWILFYRGSLGGGAGPFTIYVDVVMESPTGVTPQPGTSLPNCANVALVGALAGEERDLADNTPPCVVTKIPGIELVADVACDPEGGVPGVTAGDSVAVTVSFENAGTVRSYGNRVVWSADPYFAETGDSSTTPTVLNGDGTSARLYLFDTTQTPARELPLNGTVPLTRVGNTWTLGTTNPGDVYYYKNVGVPPGAIVAFTVQGQVASDVGNDDPILSAIDVYNDGRSDRADPPPPETVEQNRANNVDTCGPTAYLPDPRILKTAAVIDGDTPLTVGDRVSYTITYNNQGGVAAPATIQDALPRGTKLVLDESFSDVPSDAVVSFTADGVSYDYMPNPGPDGIDPDVVGFQIDFPSLAAPANKTTAFDSDAEFGRGAFSGTIASNGVLYLGGADGATTGSWLSPVLPADQVVLDWMRLVVEGTVDTNAEAITITVTDAASGDTLVGPIHPDASGAVSLAGLDPARTPAVRIRVDLVGAFTCDYFVDQKVRLPIPEEHETTLGFPSETLGCTANDVVYGGGYEVEKDRYQGGYEYNIDQPLIWQRVGDTWHYIAIEKPSPEFIWGGAFNFAASLPDGSEIAIAEWWSDEDTGWYAYHRAAGATTWTSEPIPGARNTSFQVRDAQGDMVRLAGWLDNGGFAEWRWQGGEWTVIPFGDEFNFSTLFPISGGRYLTHAWLQDGSDAIATLEPSATGYDVVPLPIALPAGADIASSDSADAWRNTDTSLPLVWSDEGGARRGMLYATDAAQTTWALATVDESALPSEFDLCDGYTAFWCNSSSSLSIVQGSCVGQASCEVPANNSLFGDPCGGVYKRLAATFTCTDGSSSCGVVNEGNVLTLSCPEGATIQSIDMASYGTPISIPSSTSSNTRLLAMTPQHDAVIGVQERGLCSVIVPQWGWTACSTANSQLFVANDDDWIAEPVTGRVPGQNPEAIMAADGERLILTGYDQTVGAQRVGTWVRDGQSWDLVDTVTLQASVSIGSRDLVDQFGVLVGRGAENRFWFYLLPGADSGGVMQPMVAPETGYYDYPSNAFTNTGRPWTVGCGYLPFVREDNDSWTFPHAGVTPALATIPEVGATSTYIALPEPVTALQGITPAVVMARGGDYLVGRDQDTMLMWHTTDQGPVVTVMESPLEGLGYEIYVSEVSPNGEWVTASISYSGTMRSFVWRYSSDSGTYLPYPLPTVPSTYANIQDNNNDSPVERTAGAERLYWEVRDGETNQSYSDLFLPVAPTTENPAGFRALSEMYPPNEDNETVLVNVSTYGGFIGADGYPEAVVVRSSTSEGEYYALTPKPDRTGYDAHPLPWADYLDEGSHIGAGGVIASLEKGTLIVSRPTGTDFVTQSYDLGIEGNHAVVSRVTYLDTGLPLIAIFDYQQYGTEYRIAWPDAAGDYHLATFESPDPAERLAVGGMAWPDFGAELANRYQQPRPTSGGFLYGGFIGGTVMDNNGSPRPVWLEPGEPGEWQPVELPLDDEDSNSTVRVFAVGDGQPGYPVIFGTDASPYVGDLMKGRSMVAWYFPDGAPAVQSLRPDGWDELVFMNPTVVSKPFANATAVLVGMVQRPNPTCKDWWCKITAKQAVIVSDGTKVRTIVSEVLGDLPYYTIEGNTWSRRLAGRDASSGLIVDGWADAWSEGLDNGWGSAALWGCGMSGNGIERIEAVYRSDEDPSFEYTLEVGNWCQAELVNEAVISTPMTEITAANNRSGVTLPVSTARVATDLVTSRGVAEYGDSVVFTYKVTNHGPGPARDIVASLIVPDGDGINASRQTWRIPELAAGQTTTTARNVSVSAGQDGALLVASLEASCDGSIDCGLSDNVASATTFVSRMPNVYIRKSADFEAAVGEEITWTITFGNNGNAPAEGVIVVDDIPAAVSIVDAALPEMCTLVGNHLECQMDELFDGEEWEVSLLGVVDSCALSGAMLDNTAEISAVDDIDASDNADSSSTTLLPALGQVELTAVPGVGSATTGGLVTWFVHYRNTGIDDVTGARITAAVPGGTTWISGGSHAGGVVTFTLPSPLAAGAQGSVSFVTRVTATQGTLKGVANLALVGEGGAAAGPADAGACPTSASFQAVAVAAPGLTVTKQASRLDTCGGNVDWIVTVSNSGDTALAALLVADTIPSGISYVAGSITGVGANAAGAPVLLWTVPGIPAHSAVQLGYRTTAPAGAGALVTNVATVEQGGRAIASSAPVVVRDDCDAPMRLSKAWDATCAQPGERVTVVVTYENTGDEPLDNVVVMDVVQDGFSDIITPAGDGSYAVVTATAPARPRVRKNVGTLAAHATGTFTYSAVLGAQAGAIVLDSATMSAAGQSQVVSNQVSGMVLVCDDGNVCSVDRCEPFVGCVYEPNTDYDPVATTCGAGACMGEGTQSCDGLTLIDDCEPGTTPQSIAGVDTLCNGVDDDCDGTVTDEDGEFEEYTAGCGGDECEASSEASYWCEGGEVVNDCDPAWQNITDLGAPDSTCEGGLSLVYLVVQGPNGREGSVRCWKDAAGMIDCEKDPEDATHVYVRPVLLCPGTAPIVGGGGDK